MIDNVEIKVTRTRCRTCTSKKKNLIDNTCEEIVQACLLQQLMVSPTIRDRIRY